MTYRKELEKIAEEQGISVLYEQLKAVDPASCDSIHENNVKRVIRALEYYHETGQPISAHNAEQRTKEEAYDAKFFVITDDRAQMYERIDQRVDKMVEAGLVAEVQKLKDMGIPRSAVSMQGLGYKEIFDYLNGECSLENAVYTIKRDTRHFAKRQLTWFKREPSVIWIDRSVYAHPAKKMLEIIENT